MNQRALVAVISRNMGTDGDVAGENECRPDCLVLIRRELIEKATDKAEGIQMMEVDTKI